MKFYLVTYQLYRNQNPILSCQFIEMGNGDPCFAELMDHIDHHALIGEWEDYEIKNKKKFEMDSKTLVNYINNEYVPVKEFVDRSKLRKRK